MTESHMLLSVTQDFFDLDFEYLEQFLYALMPMSLTVIFHGVSMDIVRRCFKRFGRPLINKGRYPLKRTALMVSIISIMLASHFLGIIIWGAFYVVSGVLPNLQTAMYFSGESYTTLGASNINLPGRWIGFGGLEAMTGVLMFGWSTAILAAIVQKLHSIDD